ncbi:MAG: sigma-70 family RNA polymerase sigma factor [Gemmatimonadales bacterium]|nr:sigma-70 family RNA polymerase sigma factor [Gemmatimonadales bacterium]MDZ4388330.1 sigma-70 family RNA polymerase sigma factor [Gemmatimonadales bacterium]
MRDGVLMDRLARARAGEERAGEEVLAWLLPRINRYVAARCRTDPVLAEDILQDALWRVWCGLARCQALSPGQLVAWALAVAHRALLDADRAAPPRALRMVGLEALERAAPTEEAAAIADPVIRAAAEVAARTALRLPGVTGYLLWARIMEGATWGEAAARLGTTPAGAKRRFQRARARLAGVIRATLLPTLGRPPPAWLAARAPPAETPQPCSGEGGD